MESNTPTPIQRNRRAGRMTALPSETPLVVPDKQYTTAQTGTGTPAAAPAAALQQPMQPPTHPSQEPMQPPRTGYSAPQHSVSGATYPWQNIPPASAPQRPAAQAPAPRPQPRPAAQPQARMQSSAGYAPYPQQPRAQRPLPQRQSASAGERPRAYGNTRALQQTPEARRTSALAEQQTAPARNRKTTGKPRKAPSWMWTVFSLMLVGTMALFAFSMLLQAHLKTDADQRQQAWEKIMYNYHVTEQEDGTLRVTWQDTIEHYAQIYNLNPAFVTAIIRNESSFRATAESSVGARGLMQMMPDTAEWIAGKLDEPFDFDRLYDPETSIRYGCWYLNFLSEMFSGDTVLVCAAYHAGQGEVWSWLGDRNISPDGITVPIENIPISNTKTYAGRVTQAYGIYETLLYPPPPSAPAEPAAVHDADPLSASGS